MAVYTKIPYSSRLGSGILKGLSLVVTIPPQNTQEETEALRDLIYNALELAEQPAPDRGEEE